MRDKTDEVRRPRRLRHLHRWHLVVVAAAVCFFLAPAASWTRAQTPRASSETQLELTLPSGTRAAGRQAFVDLRCVACHRTVSDPEADFPDPVSASPGPDLGPRQAAQGAGVLATSIISPSHEISLDPDDDLLHPVDDIVSPMGDYSQVMTVRQLVDLVAYLQSLAVP